MAANQGLYNGFGPRVCCGTLESRGGFEFKSVLSDLRGDRRAVRRQTASRKTTVCAGTSGNGGADSAVRQLMQASEKTAVDFDGGTWSHSPAVSAGLPPRPLAKAPICWPLYGPAHRTSRARYSASRSHKPQQIDSFSLHLGDSSSLRTESGAGLCRSIIDGQPTSTTITAPKIRLTTLAPKPKPPFSTGCDNRSPQAAPKGRVRIYAAQKQRHTAWHGKQSVPSQ